LGHKLRRDLLVDSSGNLWSVCLKPDGVPCWIDPAKPEELHLTDSVQGYQAAVRDAAGAIWVANDDEAASLRDNDIRKLRRLPTIERRRQSPLLPGREGQFWFVGDRITGTNPEIEFYDRPASVRFPPTAGFQDSRGNLWVAYLGQGLVKWSTDWNWRRWFPEDFEDEAPVQVLRVADDSLILSTHKHLYRWNARTAKWSPFTAGEHRFDGVTPLEDGGFLASVRDLGIVRLSSDGRFIETIADLSGGEQHREVFRDGKGQIWIAAKRGLQRVEGTAGAFTLRSIDLPGEPINGNEQAVDLETDSTGRLWVGYQNGIAWLDDDDRWRQLKTDQPVTFVRSFTVAGDDIWVAHRRAGGFTRLHRNGEIWNVTFMSAGSGYGPTDTNFVKRDSRGWIWRGSTQGIHVADGTHFAPEDWIHIPMGKGLAANETEIYGFFEDGDGSVWISGDEGLTHLRPDPSWFRAPSRVSAPTITQMEADGQVFLFPVPLPQVLPLNLKTLRVEVGALTGPEFRDAPIRYRLLPDDEAWKVSSDGTLDFLDLSEKVHTLELGWVGEGPANITAYSFRVGAAASRISWVWFAAPLMMVMALVVVGRYTPLLETPMFKVEKAIFMLRRRYDLDSHGGPELADPFEDVSGRILAGRYRLSRVISRGVFSAVFEAADMQNEEGRVAVKVLNVPAGQDRGVRQRFAQEVAALRSVRHPGVVPILDSWIETGGEPCLAMPFLEGQTIRDALADAPLEKERAARIIGQIGSALAEVHSHGIVHRDLKPENLMLTNPGTDAEQAVILDFGTAGLRTAENRLAATTLLAGSFHYMAPERLAGRYSPASDVFSFAVIVMEILTGKRLSDLASTFWDASFGNDLEMTLREVLPQEAAAEVARSLAPAFDPEPQKRPGTILEWSGGLAQACLQTRVD
jgi:ligand-binding sensor domain-containing protein